MLKLLLKWLLNGAIVVAFLIYYADIPFWSADLAATGLTFIAYIIGDQVLLRHTNNIIATLADFMLAAVYITVLSSFLNWRQSWAEMLFISGIVALSEWVLHRYVFNEKLQIA
ncbi:MAG TPA: DUF2512 family protein [Paenibacillus sp.]|uniref:DUF2512 family protein n=1 Tax=Paenibacillus sp. TaxID=58172 RepID=UPI0028D90B42|nr:DUF2512 family protein [Paenibacillus sp.]HUC92317.1 DUF2512 family protein [Paenibacillus sp.]